VDGALLAAVGKSMADEFRRMQHRIVDEVLDGSDVHALALAYQKGCKRFLESRGLRGLPGSAGVKLGQEVEEKVVAVLERATADERREKERAQVLDALKMFRRRVLDLSRVFLVLGHVGLLETDEVGKFVCDVWGYWEAEELAVSRARKRLREKPLSRDGLKALFADALESAWLAFDGGGG
jgi:hypothetical protein